MCIVIERHCVVCRYCAVRLVSDTVPMCVSGTVPVCKRHCAGVQAALCRCVSGTVQVCKWHCASV